MKKINFLVLFAFTSFLLSAQNSTEKELELLQTPEDIETFLKSNTFKKNKLITFNEEKHRTTLAKELFELSKGGVKTVTTDYDKTIYKVIDKSTVTNYRFSYIVLDATQINLSNINELRMSIIKKHEDGASFDFLAQRYSMDENATRGGDTGWFAEGDHTYDFESVLIGDTHIINDIFTIDMPTENKYYVILKTYDPKDIAQINVLKIVESF